MYEQKDGGSFWWATDRSTGQEKRTKNGDKYMTGSITINGQKMNATLFYQKVKKNANGPDISILFASASPDVMAVKERMANVPPPTESHFQVDEIDPDSIPF